MVQVFATRLKPQYIGTQYRCVSISLSSDFKGAITEILHSYSMAHTEEPYANKYIGTQVFIPSRYQYSMYSSNSCNCAEFLSTDKIPRQARPVELIKHHYDILIAPEKCMDVPVCLTTFPPQAVELCKIRAGSTTTACCICFRLGRT